jgi:diguanylate cyclase (GGDEF)-like protein
VLKFCSGIRRVADVGEVRMRDVAATPHGEIPRSLPFRVYLGTITALGLGALALVVASSWTNDVQALAERPAFWVILALVLVGELRPILTDSSRDSAGITTSTMFSFAALLFFGLAGAVAVQAFATVVTAIVHRKQLWRTGFNLGQHTFTLMVAWWVLDQGGVSGVPTGASAPTGRDLIYVGLAGLVCFAFNNGFVWVAVALAERRPLLATIRADVAYQFVVHATLVGLAPLVAVVMAYRWQLLPLFVLPLFAVQKNAVSSQERERQSLRDPLTGLANRKLLVRTTESTLRSARGESVGLFLLDLDRFKEVNDTLGHAVGDRVLQLAGERLERTLRPGDVVARLGGDEFAVLLPVVRDADAAREIAQRISAAMEEPFTVRDTQIDLEASIGIAMFPQHGTDFEALLQRADVAMYVAKSERTTIETYAAERDTNNPSRLGLLGALRRAIDGGELELHYQPKVMVGDGSAAGVEALVRWRHPTRGLVLPDDFIPLAERSGLMQRLTDFVLETALAQAATWRRDGMPMAIAVNVSMRDLHDTEFAGRLGEGLRRHGVPADLLCLEITERVLMADVAKAATTLDDLDGLGVRISLDDFGTGYSSLVLLKRLPVREIKVDRSFVKRLGSAGGAQDDATIVRSIIDLGHSLGLTVVAEGVESEATMDRLRAFGCDRAQGWHLSPALPAADVTSWLKIRALDSARLRLATT